MRLFLSQAKSEQLKGQGTLAAAREGNSSNGRYCRECRQTITVGGKEKDTFGAACQHPVDVWEIVSD